MFFLAVGLHECGLYYYYYKCSVVGKAVLDFSMSHLKNAQYICLFLFPVLEMHVVI